MRATADTWKNTPFGHVIPIPYRATFDASQFERLKDGLIPREMEDKWFVFFDEAYLQFHRSWTGQPVYRVAFTPGNACDFNVVSAECASDVASKSEPAYEAQVLDFLICNLLLGQSKPFPRPAGAAGPSPGVIQHHVAGTRYPERVVAKAPWWKFWR